MRRQRGIAQGWLLLIALAVVLGLLGWLHHAIDSKAYRRGVDETMVKWARANQEQREREAAQHSAASKKVETGNAKAKTVYRTITQQVDRIVDRPVYRNVCLDDDGLRLVAAALRGESPNPGKPDKPVPAAAGSFRWEWSLSAAADRAGG